MDDIEANALTDDLACDIPHVPGGLIVLPRGSLQVLDADEEVFLLYSRPFENKDEDGIQGLGSVDSRANNLTLTFTLRAPLTPEEAPTSPKARKRLGKVQSQNKNKAEKVIEIELFQDVTGLRSRRGDTAWFGAQGELRQISTTQGLTSLESQTSVHLARLLLQHHFYPPSPPDTALLNPEHLTSARILELGSGTGVLGCALLPLLPSGHITLTDIPELVPLLRKNAKSDKVTVEPLDWTWPILPSFVADLVLCVDCIYNTALIQPLVRVLATFDAPVMVVIELRDESVVRAFLEEWLNWRLVSDDQNKAFRVWRLPDGLLNPHFVAWVGWKGRDEQSN